MGPLNEDLIGLLIKCYEPVTWNEPLSIAQEQRGLMGKMVRNSDGV